MAFGANPQGGDREAWREGGASSAQRASELVRFHPDDIERLADRIADRLAPRIADDVRHRLSARALVDAAEAARMLGITRGAVYRKAQQLGGMRVGNSRNAPWRFDRDRLLAAMAACSAGRDSSAENRPQRRRSRRRQAATTANGFPLLPFRGLE